MEKKNPIDRILKEKLEGMQIPFDADSWQLMQQKLEDEPMGIDSEGQPVADIKDIDEAIFEKLHRYNAPYQASHWKRMEALLEEVFAWPRQVLRYKLAELALMLLLFLLLWQYIPGDSTRASSSPQALESTLTAPPSTQNTISTPPGEDDSMTSETLSQLNSDTEDISQPSSPLSTGSGRGPIHRGGASGLSNSNTAGAMSASANEVDDITSRSITPLPLAERRAPLLKVPSYPLPAMPTVLSNGLFTELDWLETLSGELAYEKNQDVGDIAFIKNKNGIGLRVGMFGSAEYNHITVPSSEEKRLENDLQRYAMGYGGGLSLGLEKGRFEIETGAIYAARRYPVGLVYINGSVGGGLQGQRLEASELNIINVPLHFRYSFISRGGWRAYALAGASLQVAFQRNYYVAEEPQFDFLPMQPPPAPTPAPADEGSTIDRIRRSGLGWFEGGTFEENAYLTGNLGLGLERYITPRWSIFVQPTYQHSLQYFRVGLGPNADQINSLSVLFGAKVRVK